MPLRNEQDAIKQAHDAGYRPSLGWDSAIVTSKPIAHIAATQTYRLSYTHVMRTRDEILSAPFINDSSDYGDSSKLLAIIEVLLDLRDQNQWIIDQNAHIEQLLYEEFGD